MKTQTKIKMLTAVIEKAPKSDQISRFESHQDMQTISKMQARTNMLFAAIEKFPKLTAR